MEKHNLKNSSYYINQSGITVIELVNGSSFYIKDKYSLLEAYDIVIGELYKNEILLYLCREKFSSEEMSWLIPYEELVDLCLRWLYQNNPDNFRILKEKINEFETN